jgi:hypothetical protein
MADVIAFVRSGTRGKHVDLRNFKDTSVLELAVPSGNYVIYARVQLANTDGDDQNAAARLAVTLPGEGGGLLEVDFADIRLPGNTQEIMHLQGALPVKFTDVHSIIQLRCSTFSGFATYASLHALQVAGITDTT